jgi:hypothetical protein
VNRDAKTQSALVALARTRRLQRALAHASIHRDAPLPGLRLSLGYMTSTARQTDEAGAIGHTMSVLGIAVPEGFAYVVEELGPSETETPIVYRLWLAGPRCGHLVPIHAWYEQCEDAAEIRARISAISATLEPVARTTTEAWMLSTRVVQRRALRVASRGSGAADRPIRKFALQLRVEAVSGHGASGHTTVTAYLRPEAELVEVMALTDGRAIARVRYTGIPSGFGQSKETVVLLTE